MASLLGRVLVRPEPVLANDRVSQLTRANTGSFSCTPTYHCSSDSVTGCASPTEKGRASCQSCSRLCSCCSAMSASCACCAAMRCAAACACCCKPPTKRLVRPSKRSENACHLRKTRVGVEFSYVCPEPVLVNDDFCITKRRFQHRTCSQTPGWRPGRPKRCSGSRPHAAGSVPCCCAARRLSRGRPGRRLMTVLLCC
jgi:hypothetical protein